MTFAVIGDPPGSKGKADSTGRCNSSMESFSRGFVVQRFPRLTARNDRSASGSRPWKFGGSTVSNGSISDARGARPKRLGVRKNPFIDGTPIHMTVASQSDKS